MTKAQTQIILLVVLAICLLVVIWSTLRVISIEAQLAVKDAELALAQQETQAAEDREAIIREQYEELDRESTQRIDAANQAIEELANQFADLQQQFSVLEHERTIIHEELEELPVRVASQTDLELASNIQMTLVENFPEKQPSYMYDPMEDFFISNRDASAAVLISLQQIPLLKRDNFNLLEQSFNLHEQVANQQQTVIETNEKFEVEKDLRVKADALLVERANIIASLKNERDITQDQVDLLKSKMFWQHFKPEFVAGAGVLIPARSQVDVGIFVGIAFRIPFLF